MNAFAEILETLRRTPLYCKHCDGEGRIFSSLTINPSEKPKWRDCEDCNGSGMGPEPDEDEAGE